jgi:endonuclease-3
VTPAKRLAFFARLAAETPEPRTELVYSSPFELLVAVILSAQATDKSVNLATRGLYAAARTPAALVALGLDGLKRHIRTIGLYNSKAKNILEMSRLLLERHGGEVPRDRASLEALPGVGRKTANVVLNCVFGEPTIAVDTHIFRVANRTGLAPGRNVVEVEQRLLKVVPAGYHQHAHHWLILLGRYTCKARRPECWRCPVRPECGFRPKTPAADAEFSAPGRAKRS